ncbi:MULTISPECIES: hypothetical protein [unclassified Streptomyces]|uniref:hypothetical protein n=1 Tax=unclassified Streptomyces TaxID=2593676 RepID=UPI0038155C2C
MKKAAKASAHFVKQHAATIASVAVGVVVFAGCTAATGGVGVIGCAALAGAAANGVGYMMSDGPKSVGGFLGSVAVGAATGALGGAAGGLAAGAAGRLLAGVGGRVVQGAAQGTAGGAAEGAVGYGISCASSEEGCSVSGAAKVTAIGAATGGIFGAAAGKFATRNAWTQAYKLKPGQKLQNDAGDPDELFREIATVHIKLANPKTFHWWHHAVPSKGRWQARETPVMRGRFTGQRVVQAARDCPRWCRPVGCTPASGSGLLLSTPAADRAAAASTVS